ncbi:hypothetical protein KFE94_09190 [bacterium SCSIO 12643]|nr:hypothetical protein KFE94_09190 [bacterium SCSIO 12643]
MLLRIFRTSQPLSWILIIVLITILRVVLFSFFYESEQSFDNKLISSNILNQFGSGFPWISHITSTIYILFSGLFFNRIVQNLNLVSGIHYLLFFLFGIFISFYPENLILSPFVTAVPLLLLSYHLIMTQFKGMLPMSIVFNASFFIGLASMIYFPSAILLAILIWSLIYLNQTSWRHFFIAVIGFGTPALFFDTIVFSFSLPVEYIFSYWSDQFQPLDLKNYLPAYATYTILGLILLQSFIYFRTVSKSIIKIRKALHLSFWYLILGIIFNGFLSAPFPNMVNAIIIPLSMLFTIFHLEVKRWWISDLFFIALIGSLVSSYLYT